MKLGLFVVYDMINQKILSLISRKAKRNHLPDNYWEYLK